METVSLAQSNSMNYGVVGGDQIARDKIGMTVQAQGAIHDISLPRNCWGHLDATKLGKIDT